MPVNHLFSLFILLSLIACDNKKNEKPLPQKQESRLEVGVFKVVKQEINLSSELFGRVLSTNVAEIRPQVSGIILERSFEEGSYVKKGQQLYQIDPAPYRAALNLAEGRLDQARASQFSAKALMKRYNTLIKTNAISRQEYDDAKAALQEADANVKVAQAEVERARINLTYTQVLSPISGYVGRTTLTTGALATANQVEALTTVRSLDPVYVDMSFPANEALQLRNRLGKYLIKDESGKGLSVTLKLEAINETYPHKGRIEARELSIDEDTGTVLLRAVVPNPELVLLPGMYVRAYVDQLGYGEKLVVPQAAIERDQNGDANVWVVNADSTVERRRIETGIQHKKNWIVENGLKAGELIALDNFQKLKAGMNVRPISEGREAQEKGEK